MFQVKKPEESKRDWDYYKLLATVPGETADPTAAESRPADKVNGNTRMLSARRSVERRAAQEVA